MAPPPGMNLDSAPSIRENRVVSPDYTVVLGWCDLSSHREHIALGMRGVRVEVERRLDGSRWMHWHHRILALECCETRPEVILERRSKARVTSERSVAEKQRARQRVLDARRRLKEAYAQLPNRPLWQAMKDFPLPAPALRCRRCAALRLVRPGESTAPSPVGA
jgi:hypothetical protein